MSFKPDCANNFLTPNGSASLQPYSQPLMSTFALPIHSYLPIKPLGVASNSSAVPPPPIPRLNFLSPSTPTFNSAQLQGTQTFPNLSVASTGRQLHANTVNAAGVLSPPATLATENKQPVIDSSSAIGVYRKYYTDVLGYFKTLLDSLENGGSSATNRGQSTISSNVQNCRPLDNDPWSHSKTVMEGYFRQSGARDWDWASWHNYLSWISRTHPEWFQLFSECSKQMGIDWDVMYQKWLASKSNAKDQAPVFDLSRPPPASTSNPQQAPPPPIANPFCLTSVPPPQDPRVWCEDCDKYFPTQRSYDIHLRGVCHIQNALTKTITNNASAVLDIPPPQWAPQVHPPHVELAVPRSKPAVDLRPSQKRQLRIQHLLDICIQPLVGLNYITEFQRRGLLECVYVCDLCEKRAFLPPAVIKHVCSIRHRMAYLKYHYPPLHQLISLDRSPESIRKRRLTSYAQQVESSEGRKRLSIMLEKENSTFKTRIEPLEPKKLQGFPLASAQNTTRDDKVLETSPRTEVADVMSTSTAQSREPDENNTNEIGDDEIEEGEMLDCSTSSSSSAPEDQEGSTKKEGITSPASSHFSDEEDGDSGEYDNSKLPSFFSTGVVESSDSRQSSIFVHLPDFEIGFVSERPLLPDLPTADECTEFVERLKRKGLLGVRRLATSEASEQQQRDTTLVEVVPTDSELGWSFEEEMRWALKRVEAAGQKANPLQFSFKSRPKITAPSAPLLPDPPTVLSNEVENQDSGVNETSTTQNGSNNPESVKRVVKTLLGDFKPSLPPLQPLLGSRHGQTIPVIMSNQPHPLLPQPHPASILKRDNPQVNVLGDPPKRPKLNQLDGVKSLLSSPLDALQALLKGNLGASGEQQLREESETSGPPAPTTQSPTNSSPCPTEIFDGYSYFSRQEEEETKTQERTSTTKTPLITHRQRQSIIKSATTNIATAQGRSSKLATFADMLGMNEPPAPLPPSRPPPPPTPVQPTVPPVPTAATTGILGAGLAPAAWLAPPSLWQPPAVIPAQALAAPSSSTAAAAALAAAAGGFSPAAFVMPTNMFGPMLRPPIWRP